MHSEATDATDFRQEAIDFRADEFISANEERDDDGVSKEDMHHQDDDSIDDSHNSTRNSQGRAPRRKQVRFAPVREFIDSEVGEEGASKNSTTKLSSPADRANLKEERAGQTGERIRFVKRRPMIVNELLGEKGSSPSNPDSTDMLRRVSILVAQHILRGERMRMRARSSGRRIQTNNGLSVAVPSSTRDRIAERWKASQQFGEVHFVRPQRRHYLDVIPGLHLLTCFDMVYVRPDYRHPSHRTIFSFIQRLFKKARLDSGCSIICLIYVERLMERTGLFLLRRNWRPIMLVSMLIASKMWQDLGCWNKEFSKIYPQFSCRSIKRLERLFIAKLQWNTIISSSVYSKYYFELRSLNEKKKFRSKYLNMVGVRPALPKAKRIEVVSKKKAMVLSRSM